MPRAKLVLILLLAGASRALAATLQPLGDLPGGSFSSAAWGVSADGSVVVGAGTPASGYGEAFRWTAGAGMVGLGELPSGFLTSGATGVSADGSVVVGYSTRPYDLDPYDPAGYAEAFRWTAGEGMVGLGHLPGGDLESRAFGVSADGSVVVGGSDSALGGQTFRWTSNTGMVGLGVLPGKTSSAAWGISADGSVVVGAGFGNSGSEAFRWTSSTGMVGLGHAPGETSSAAWGVSADGSVVVGNMQPTYGPGGEAFRWTASEGMVGLGFPPGGSIATVVYGLSTDGRVIVGRSLLASGDLEAIRWTAGTGMQRLWDVLLAQGVNPAAGGWTRLSEATAISADGNTIVGYGTRNGNAEAFLAFVPNSVAQLPGDFNHDGKVNAADYVVWRKSGGTQTDYNTWRTNFGRTAGSGSVIPSAESLSAAVPEPTTMAILSFGLVAMFGAFSRRWQLRRRQHRANHGHAFRRSHFEPLEDRCLLSFTPAVSYTAGIEPQAVVTSDFNNDGRLDLATANYGAGSVNVLLGNGSGGFGAAIASAAGANPVSIAVGDFNADGKLDLATANEGSNNISVLLANGNGSFQAPTNMLNGPTPNSVAVGDFNNDGKLDLVATANWYFPYSYPQGLAAVFLGHGDGSFSVPIFGNAGFDRPINSEAVGDFNNDGKLDLVISDNAYAEIQVLPGDGQGLLNPSGSLRTSAWHRAESMAVGDINADGSLDLVMASGYDVGVSLGNSQGGLTFYPASYEAGSTPISVALADFDRDGRLDIVTANADSNDVSILRGVGEGMFSAAENFAVGSGALTTAGDVNDDGKVDAADYVLWRKNGGTTNQYNTWRANFGSQSAADLRPLAVTTGDFNGDGWLDAATANSNGDSISVLINDRSWSVVPPRVSIGDTFVTEGNTGTASAAFTVTLSKPTNLGVTVHYSTADISAAAGSDYVAASGTITIPAGQTSGAFTVEVLGDRLAEPNEETFAISLSAPTNATIGDGYGIGTILDDEPRISINDVTKSEGKGNKMTLFTFAVTLSVAYDQPVTISYRTVDGTATTSDGDYIAQTGTLTFAPGETTKTITIEVKADNKKEPNETFYLDLFDNSSNSLFTKFRGIGTILNDD